MSAATRDLVLASAEPISAADRTSLEAELHIKILGPSELARLAALLEAPDDAAYFIDRGLLLHAQADPRLRPVCLKIERTVIRRGAIQLFDRDDEALASLLATISVRQAADDPVRLGHIADALQRHLRAHPSDRRPHKSEPASKLLTLLRESLAAARLDHPDVRQAPSDDTARAKFIEDFGLEPTDPKEAEALYAKAPEEAAEERTRVLATCLTTPQVQKILGGIQREAVRKRIAKGGLLAVKEKGDYRFPKWQFDPHADDGVVPGLPEVLAALPGRPYGKLRWLSAPHAELNDRTPIKALGDGDLEDVLAAAHALNA